MNVGHNAALRLLILRRCPLEQAEHDTVRDHLTGMHRERAGKKGRLLRKNPLLSKGGPAGPAFSSAKGIAKWMPGKNLSMGRG